MKNQVNDEQNLNQGSVSKDFVLSRDPNQAMQDMMDTIDALSAVFTEENEALISADTKRFLDLQNRKIDAAKKYQAKSKQFIKLKSELSNAQSDIKEKFEQKYSEFSSLAQDNLHHLERMNKGLERLHHHIMNAARETVDKEGVNYSAGAQLKTHTRGLSMGVNESA